MAAPGQPEGDPLEDRLRSLIIGNSKRDLAQQAQGQAQPGPDSALGPSSPGSQPGPAGSSKTARKRPNQAQRRQMSAQLSIPIDTRTQFHPSPRAFASPPGAHHQQHPRGAHHRIQEPRSATFGPPGRGGGNPIPSAPLTGLPFPPRSRHQQSLSYHGPMTVPNQFGWPQQPPPPMRHGDPRMSYPMPAMSPMPHLPFDAPSPMHPAQGHGASDLSSPQRPFNPRPNDLSAARFELLDNLCSTIVADAEIETAEIAEKENFRIVLEQVARTAIAEHERLQNGSHDFPPESVKLKCFGSLASGFATKASDMDLGIFSPHSAIQPDGPGSQIPRLVEKAFLDIGLGARLLTQTRVPIIKVCQKPLEDLRLALVAERAKWERGATQDLDEIEPQEDPDPPLVLESVQAAAQPSVQTGHPEESQQHQETTGLTRDQLLQQFRQGDASSLSTYYASAKRLLRKLGGRDITHSNIMDFRTDDAQLLNQVNMAFVDGLADADLRGRLLRYRSFNRYELTSRENNLRTLLGVLTQVEGEQMAILWESRPFQEKDENEEGVAETALRAWRVLGDKPEYGRDPLFYQKELQLAVEQLKKIPTLQVLLLAQTQNEPAAAYCSRALRLLHELGGQASRARSQAVVPTLMQHYIGGISNHAIREQVLAFQQIHGTNNVRSIGRRHKSLQLAHEYETCLRKGLYAHDTAAKVQRYIELLRAPIAKSPSAGHSTGVIPLDLESEALVSEVRLLGDPSKAAPNQPRDRFSNALEFPKSGVGVQCDINFSAHLGVQNTLLLRCYSLCDPRVRPLVLFIKHWAKVRRINTPYRGTLSSYGYVLMMLHYLVNVAQPFVCPNLQQLARSPDPSLTPQQAEETVQCKGCNIQFWRDEAEIARLARDNVLTQNRESVGQLLCGFFEYYARGGSFMDGFPCRSFDWGRDVLSLRTHGGLLSKQTKGWTGAKTVVEVKEAAAPPPNAAATTTTTTTTPAPPGAEPPLTPQPAPGQQQPAQTTALETKEVRYRYLFAIEDPFELDHNVARTVTHAGIVNIRDEFRRAWRIIKRAGQQHQGQGGEGEGRQEDLLEDVGCAEEAKEREQFTRLLADLHGVEL